MSSKIATVAANTVLMLMIGDGVLALLAPKEHARLWRVGPTWFRDFMHWFERHPEWTRVVAFLELGLGLSLAMRQYRREGKNAGVVRRRSPRNSKKKVSAPSRFRSEQMSPQFESGE